MVRQANVRDARACKKLFMETPESDAYTYQFRNEVCVLFQGETTETSGELDCLKKGTCPCLRKN